MKIRIMATRFYHLLFASNFMPSFSQPFHNHPFTILFEYLCVTTNETPIQQEFAGFPTAMTLADRVHSDDDMAPLKASYNYPNTIEKLIHFAGKGRDIQDFNAFLTEAKQANIKHLLLLTGDKLKGHQDGSQGGPRTRYLESVNAVMAAKEFGGFHVGVAFNPFKYVEAERDAQYLKLHKKLKAGADFIITQLGYDMQALKQAQVFLKDHHYQQQIFACVMPLSLGRANFMVKNKVAGIVITPHMLNVLAEEKQVGQVEHVYMRCAVQILMCKHLGFAGIHLSSCHQPKDQNRLENYIKQFQHLDLNQLESLWKELWQIQTGNEFIPQLNHYSYPATSTQIIKYQQLHLMHEAIFDSKIACQLGRFVFKSKFWNNSFADQALLKSEWISKHRIVGCESCGQCRLGDTLYICPETCPKGLANGPCGGTTLDRCEFGDRECIHSVKARLAKAVGETEILRENLIPTVPLEIRGSSSWKNWFLATEA
nr:methylenetetrahydrofolate reductase C-terminal domain-containing protein [Acinetobacter lanii]